MSKYNFNILLGILLGPTDLVESNEDMTLSILFCQERGDLKKEDTLDLFLRKSGKCLCEKEMLTLFITEFPII